MREIKTHPFLFRERPVSARGVLNLTRVLGLTGGSHWLYL